MKTKITSYKNWCAVTFSFFYILLPDHDITFDKNFTLFHIPPCDTSYVPLKERAPLRVGTTHSCFRIDGKDDLLS